MEGRKGCDGRGRKQKVGRGSNGWEVMKRESRRKEESEEERIKSGERGGRGCTEIRKRRRKRKVETGREG